MEGSLSLKVKDEIALHLDHKVHGQHRPCTIFVSCDENEIGIGINIIGKPHHDDVGVTIENGRLVTVTVKPVHAFHKQFCIDGPMADDGQDKPSPSVAAALKVAEAAESLEGKRKAVAFNEQRTRADVEKLREAEKQAEPKTVFVNVSSGILAKRLQEAKDKVGDLQDQLNREVTVAAENDRQLREQLAKQHEELDRLRFLEKQYHDVVSFFSRDTAAATDPNALSACKEMIKETEDLVRERLQHEADLLRAERQGLWSAVEQLEQKRKNEQGSRIYYQELVQLIRAAVVDHCKAARGCKTDELPAFVKAAVTLAHQTKLVQAIVNIKGHHHQSSIGGVPS